MLYATPSHMILDRTSTTTTFPLPHPPPSSRPGCRSASELNEIREGTVSGSRADIIHRLQVQCVLSCSVSYSLVGREEKVPAASSSFNSRFTLTHRPKHIPKCLFLSFLCVWLFVVRVCFLLLVVVVPFLCESVKNDLYC